MLQVSNQVLPVLVLLQSSKGHLGARDVLLGVLEVGELEDDVSRSRFLSSFMFVPFGLRHVEDEGEISTYQSLLVPRDTLLLVGVGVGETLNLTGLAAEETV